MSYEYASLEEVKQHLQITGPKYDAWLDVLIQEAKQVIDNYCGRPDGFRADQQPDAREFSGSGTGLQWINEAARVVKVEVKDAPTDTDYVEWDVSEWVAGRGDPLHNPTYGDRQFRPYQWVMSRPGAGHVIFISGKYTTLRGFPPDLDAVKSEGRATPTVRVTANWGYSMDTPPAVKLACLKFVGLYWQRGKAGENDSAVTPDLGITQFRKRYHNIDPDIAAILYNGRLIRPTVG